MTASTNFSAGTVVTSTWLNAIDASTFDDVVNVKRYGAVGDGTTDDTVSIQAALTAAASGGIVYFPPGTYYISALLTVPANTRLEGTSYGASIIKQNGAFFAVKMTTGASLKNLSLLGTSAATGGVDFSNCGFGECEFIKIEGFSGTSAIAVKLNECYRIRLSNCYIYNNYNGIVCSGNVTTFEFDKGTISTTNSSGKAVNATSATSVEAYFNTVYFESCFGINPIYSNTYGHLFFTNCGFEDMASNSGHTGSITNPKIIYVDNSTKLTIRDSQFSGFPSDTQTYTGSLYYVYAGDDAPAIDLSGNTFTQNGTIVGLNIYIARQNGKSSLLSIANNLVEGTGYLTVLAAETALIGGIDPTYASRMFSAYGNRINVAGVGSATYNKVDTLEIVPPTGFTSTNNAVISSNSANYVAYTRTFPKNSFPQGTGLRLSAWGRRTGTANNKRALLQLTDSGASSWLASATLSTATDWRTDIIIIFRDTGTQSISISSLDGTSSSVSSNLGTKDSSGYALKLDILLDVTNAADSMTLDGLILERI